MNGYWYERADERWRPKDIIEVLAVLNTEIAYFPLVFVKRGGTMLGDLCLICPSLMTQLRPVEFAPVFKM